MEPKPPEPEWMDMDSTVYAKCRKVGPDRWEYTAKLAVPRCKHRSSIKPRPRCYLPADHEGPHRVSVLVIPKQP